MALGLRPTAFARLLGEEKQISKLNKCKLERVGSLSYVFDSVVEQKQKTVGPMIFQEILVTNESLGSTEFKYAKNQCGGFSKYFLFNY